MAITACRQYKVITIDYVSAFLNGTLPRDEVIYIHLPTGRKSARGQSKMVGLLRQSLEGLKHSASVWYFTATLHLQDISFNVSRYDAGLFIHCERHVYITLHVDNCRIVSVVPENAVWAKEQIAARFAIKDTSSYLHYLGMTVQNDKHGIHLSQPAYIDDLLTQFGLEDAKSQTTPMEVGLRLEFADNDTAVDDTPGASFSASLFRQCIGSLQYLVSSTRPDIAFAINYLARFNSCPSLAAWKAAKRVLRYLKGKRDLGIQYSSSPADGSSVPYVYSDSDWAGADPQYKSISGYVVLLHGAPVAWRSQRQSSVSKSTTEAEYMSASEAAGEALWLKDLLEDASLLTDIPSVLRTTNLQLDNGGALEMTQSESIKRRSRHIEIRYHCIRDWVQKGELTPTYVPSEQNVADGCTKPLSKDSHRCFLDRLGMTPPPSS